MKKIIKYSKENNRLSGNDKLNAYQAQAESILKGNNQSVLRDKSISPLSAIIPMVAVALTPIGLNAQCGDALFSPSNVHNSNALGFMMIDVDGDGTVDFELEVQTDTLILHPKNGAEVDVYAAGVYNYVTRFNTGDAINSAGTNWESTGVATMEYNGNSAAWQGAGIQVGFVGIRLEDNRLGFMEVAWDSDGAIDVATVNAGMTGVTMDENPAGNSVINAGACSALPVELIGFSAEIVSGQTILKWSTASEINNAGFELQRSTDGSDFRKIGWIEGEGNSGEILSYEFEDQSIMDNIEYYYRLKQLDFDGRFEYSSIISAISRDDSKIMVHDFYPNPANGASLYLNVTSGVISMLDIEVYDPMGKIVLRQEAEVIAGSNTITLDVNDLLSSNYFVKIKSQNFTAYKKVVIVK